MAKAAGAELLLTDLEEEVAAYGDRVWSLTMQICTVLAMMLIQSSVSPIGIGRDRLVRFHRQEFARPTAHPLGDVG